MNQPPRPSARSYWGMLILMVGLFLYAFLAAAIGGLLNDLPEAVRFFYYLIAGIAWIFPVKYLFNWIGAKKHE